MTLKPLHLALIAVLGGAIPGVAAAGSIYLNGVNIDGVTGVKFEKATVRIDAAGNVFIDAPGYKAVSSSPSEPLAQPVQPTQPVQQPPPVQQPVYQPVYQQPPPVVVAPPPPPPTITKRYWLVVKQTAPGMTEYDVDVYINAKWLMTVKNAMYNDAVDITRNLSPGVNTIVFEAKKVAQGPRKSYSTEHAMSLVVGEGNEASGNVMVDNALVSFKRTAQDADNVAKEFSFIAR